MILITGGSAQGKRAFAQRLVKERGGGPVVWSQGEAALWEDYMAGRYCCGFHLFVRRVLEGRVSPAGQPGEERGRLAPAGQEGAVKRLDALMDALLSGPPDRVLVTDEIGCGIVPADEFERMYREETGRLCCLAAKEADEVWRVCCGLGMRIK